MSHHAPRLTWTLCFAPVTGLRERPAWPEFVGPLRAVQVPQLDPVVAVLDGPFPRGTWERAQQGGITLSLGGYGRCAGLTVSAGTGGEIDGAPDWDGLRAELACVLLGAERGDGGVGVDVDRLAALLGDRLAADSAWELIGIIETAATLFEGVPDDLPRGGGWSEAHGIRLGRARGVGAGHVAFVATGYHTSETERTVQARRLAVLAEGWGDGLPALGEYGCAALPWAAAARAGARLVRALDVALEAARLAVSFAIAGGPLPEERAPDRLRTLARLEAARARVLEEADAMASLEPGLRRAAGRIGDHDDGPLVELSSRGGEAVSALRARVEAAGRWSKLLELARELEETAPTESPPAAVPRRQPPKTSP